MAKHSLEQREFYDLLIDYLREHPSLYDKKDPEYKNIHTSDDLHDSIAEHLGQPIEVILRGLKYLRSNYTSNLKLEKKYSTSGSGACPPITWPYYSRLSFLRDHIQGRNSSFCSSNMDEQDDDDCDELSQSTDISPAKQTSSVNMKMRTTFTLSPKKLVYNNNKFFKMQIINGKNVLTPCTGENLRLRIQPPANTSASPAQHQLSGTPAPQRPAAACHSSVLANTGAVSSASSARRQLLVTPGPSRGPSVGHGTGLANSRAAFSTQPTARPGPSRGPSVSHVPGVANSKAASSPSSAHLITKPGHSRATAVSHGFVQAPAANTYSKPSNPVATEQATVQWASSMSNDDSLGEMGFENFMPETPQRESSFRTPLHKPSPRQNLKRRKESGERETEMIHDVRLMTQAAQNLSNSYMHNKHGSSEKVSNFSKFISDELETLSEELRLDCVEHITQYIVDLKRKQLVRRQSE